MKTTLSLLTVLFAGAAAAVAQQTQLPSTISETGGRTYQAVRLIKVHPDGLLVEHTPTGGGIGMSKIKFINLSKEMQERFKYDATSAAQFEAQAEEGRLRWIKTVDAAAEESAKQAMLLAKAESKRVRAWAKMKEADAKVLSVSDSAVLEKINIDRYRTRPSFR